MLYNNNCSAAQREQVIGPAMSPLLDEFISNCSKTVDSGIVSFYTHKHNYTQFIIYTLTLARNV